MSENIDLGFIQVHESHCEDCYRCVRVCPVKAIRVENAHPSVKKSLCIKCGACVGVCIQGAMSVESELPLAQSLLAGSRPVAVSLSPVCMAFYPGGPERLAASLRKLGFTYVTETAEGALMTARAARAAAESGQGRILTHCPAVVNYVERYRPELVGELIPVVSPLIAHGRMLKAAWPGCAVVAVTTCMTQKHERQRLETQGAVDAVITVDELRLWLEAQVGADIPPCDTGAAFDYTGYAALSELRQARLYPLGGGMLAAAGLPTDSLDEEYVFADNDKRVMDLLDCLADDHNCRMLEPLFCPGGCLGGPGQSHQRNTQRLRKKLLAYGRATVEQPAPEPPAAPLPGLSASFRPLKGVSRHPYSEEDVQRVFADMDMADQHSRLNCGSCGYDTCRERIIAQLNGMSEPLMCRPWVRRAAARTHQELAKLLERSPMGIVVLDEALNIVSMNPAFRKMFICNDAILGKRISYLLNAESYEKLLLSTDETIETIRSNYGVKYYEIAYSLPEQQQYVGLYTDVSARNLDLGLVKKQAIDQAQDLLEQQIMFSQEMAHYLGKSTARNEAFVSKLMELFGDD